MKIAIEANSYYKGLVGTGVYSRNIVNTWLNNQKDIEILLFSNKRKVEIDLSKKGNIFLRLLNGLQDILWMQIVLPFELVKNDVDVLFCPDFISPIFSPCPVVVIIHDMVFLRHKETCDQLFRFYVKATLVFTRKTVNKIITDSNFSKNEIVELLELEPEKVIVVYGGCNEKYRVITNSSKINEIKEKYNIDKKYILSVGTLEPRKNIITLIAAFNFLKQKKLIEHKLVLCGNKGWYYKDIFKKIKELSLDKEIVFTGYVTEDDLPYLYNTADLFVFPSYYEGFGLPVLEAMSCGCPVITSNTSSLPEVVGDAGLLINPNNVEELSGAILKVLTENNLHESMKKKGIEQAKKFSWEKSAGEILNLLRNQISQ